MREKLSAKKTMEVKENKNIKTGKKKLLIFVQRFG